MFQIKRLGIKFCKIFNYCDVKNHETNMFYKNTVFMEILVKMVNFEKSNTTRI